MNSLQEKMSEKFGFAVEVLADYFCEFYKNRPSAIGVIRHKITSESLCQAFRDSVPGLVRVWEDEYELNYYTTAISKKQCEIENLKDTLKSLQEKKDALNVEIEDLKSQKEQLTAYILTPDDKLRLAMQEYDKRSGVVKGEDEKTTRARIASAGAIIGAWLGLKTFAPGYYVPYPKAESNDEPKALHEDEFTRTTVTLKGWKSKKGYNR